MGSSNLLLKGEQGYILVVSLLLLLTMTLMGVGLLYSVGKETKMVDIAMKSAETFHMAESCIEDAILWLKHQSKLGLTKKSNLHKIVESNQASSSITSLEVPGEDPKAKDKFKKYKYKCTITYFTEATAKGVGTGADVGLASGYGAGGQKMKYYYKITASGYGPKDAKTDIEVVASILK